MSNVINPVGPETPTVYWRRRLLAALGVVVFLIFIWWLISLKNANTPVAASTSTSSTTPTITENLATPTITENLAAPTITENLAAPRPVPGSIKPPPLKNGLPPLVTRIDTTDKIVFLTIDDGSTKDQKIIDFIKGWGVPVTSFLTKSAIADNVDYFKDIQSATGQYVQDHTLTHPFLAKLNLDGQKKEICGAADTYTNWFGTRPWMLRPPYGSWNATTVQAAKDCGMDYIVNWDAVLQGRVLVFAEGTVLKPGNIILAHWSEGLHSDMAWMFRRIAREGFKVAALQDYLPGREEQPNRLV